VGRLSVLVAAGLWAAGGPARADSEISVLVGNYADRSFVKDFEADPAASCQRPMSARTTISRRSWRPAAASAT
jgi:hypothetical protein